MDTTPICYWHKTPDIADAEVHTSSQTGLPNILVLLGDDISTALFPQFKRRNGKSFAPAFTTPHIDRIWQEGMALNGSYGHGDVGIYTKLRVLMSVLDCVLQDSSFYTTF